MHAAAPSTYRKFLPGYSIVLPHLLRSGTFAIGRTSGAARTSFPVPKHGDLTDTTQGAYVLYKGAPLRQADLRILLGLLQSAGGMVASDAVITFDANTFLKFIGKSGGTRGIQALRDSLTSLRSATFVIKNFLKDKGHTLAFVSRVSWNGRKCTVTLDKDAPETMALLGRTFVPMYLRNRLKDGLQTALLDLVYASSDESFDIEALAGLWNREAGELGRDIREALPKLEGAGAISGWEARRGRVYVKRALPASLP